MGVSRVTSSSDDFDLECVWRCHDGSASERDRKSTRLNSSHSQISYAVFCLKKKILAVDKIVLQFTLLSNFSFDVIHSVRAMPIAVPRLAHAAADNDICVCQPGSTSVDLTS